MARAFRKLTRPAMRQLVCGETITEHGISFRKLESFMVVSPIEDLEGSAPSDMMKLGSGRQIELFACQSPAHL